MTTISEPRGTAAVYRVRGPLPLETLRAGGSHARYVRMSYDHRGRALLERAADGYAVRYEGFKKAPWTWQDVPKVRRSFGPHEAEAACRYFNSLALSTRYLGPVRVDAEDGPAD